MMIDNFNFNHVIDHKTIAMNISINILTHYLCFSPLYYFLLKMFSLLPTVLRIWVVSRRPYEHSGQPNVAFLSSSLFPRNSYN